MKQPSVDRPMLPKYKYPRPCWKNPLPCQYRSCLSLKCLSPTKTPVWTKNPSQYSEKEKAHLQLFQLRLRFWSQLWQLTPLQLFQTWHYHLWSSLLMSFLKKAVALKLRRTWSKSLLMTPDIFKSKCRPFQVFKIFKVIIFVNKLLKN